MSKTWFTADHHFGHNNIIRFCERPFESASEMDRALVENWNSVVSPGDTVYHLGDFAFRGDKRLLRSLFERLHGTKHLVLGNHDHGETKRLPWASIDKMTDIIVDGQRLVLCHYALRTWPASHHGTLHLYGHSHGSLPGTHNSLDVGVDCWGFRPVDLPTIRTRLAESPAPSEDHALNDKDGLTSDPSVRL